MGIPKQRSEITSFATQMDIVGIGLPAIGDNSFRGQARSHEQRLLAAPGIAKVTKCRRCDTVPHCEDRRGKVLSEAQLSQENFP